MLSAVPSSSIVNSVIRITGIGDHDRLEWLIRISGIRMLRSWLRPHRGISQEKLPIYLGFFQFVHNARKRGKQLLAALVGALVN
jgi:transposase-like protein